jgi:hypothetical protein
MGARVHRGVIVWAVTGEHRFESGANRTGVIPPWATVATAVAAVGLIAAVWWRARDVRAAGDIAGAPSLAAVASLLVIAPILSPQYVSWLLPWGAIAGEDGPSWTTAVAVPILLTSVLVTGWFLDWHLGAGRDQLLLFARNISLVALVVAYFMRRTEAGILTRRPVRQGGS